MYICIYLARFGIFWLSLRLSHLSVAQEQLHCQLPPAGRHCLHDRADSHRIAAGAQQMQRQGPVVATPQGG